MGVGDEGRSAGEELHGVNDVVVRLKAHPYAGAARATVGPEDVAVLERHGVTGREGSTLERTAATRFRAQHQPVVLDPKAEVTPRDLEGERFVDRSVCTPREDAYVSVAAPRCGPRTAQTLSLIHI